ncbi:MAG: extracellular solute-binding protein, partial [Stenotrophomonas bentonitica]
MSLLLLLVGSLLLSACRKEPEGVTVRFWAMGREAEVVTGLIREFEAENPGIHVDVQNIPWTAAHEKLLTAFAADGLPDVCQLGNTWIPEFAELNTLTPLQPYVAQSKVVDPADYFQGIWDTNVIHDELVGVPWYVDTRLLYYRKDMLAKAGYDHPPRTWEEWNAMMAAIKKMQGANRYAVLMPINEFEQQLSFALQQPDPL